MKMSGADTVALVAHYLGLPYPQSGPDAKPVPPVLFCISKDSRDHSPEVYQEVVLPMFGKLDRPPKVRVTRWGAGVHTYRAEPDLPLGIAPPVAELYVQAIQRVFCCLGGLSAGLKLAEEPPTRIASRSDLSH
jgi:hypothetical protein